MSDRLQELAVFVRAAESGSFSRAARELGLSQPSVSRIVSDLEARLGVTLLLRTTRRITVTDAGALFLERARGLLHELEEAEDAARGVDSLRGLIRIAMPVLYGIREIVPRLPDFMKAHPLLRIECAVADELQNLIAEGADVAIRLGKLNNSSFGARKLATMQRRIVASPAYLKARGTPKTPADLSSHDCIFGPGPSARQSWSFTRNGTVTSIDVHSRLQTNSAPTVFACLMAGMGIALASDAMCREQLKTGELVEVLRGYKLEPVDVHALFPAGPRPSAKVRAFVDYLAGALPRA